MEKLLKELIEADQEAQQLVEAAKAKRQEMKKQIVEDKKAIYQQTWDRAKRTVMEKKLELDNYMKHADIENQAIYHEALNQLQATFSQHQASWLDEIVARCITK